VAVTSAWPGAIARTIPRASTATMPVSLERHWTRLRISLLPWVGTRARRVSESPGPSTSSRCDSTKSGCDTSTGKVASNRLLVETWTTVRPGESAVTRPPVSTAAISGLMDFQETLPAGAGVPSPRRATGFTRTVSPG
jgi:hypothetical protein